MTDGPDKLAGALEKASGALADLSTTLTEIANQVAAKAATNAPRRTGRLSNSTTGTATGNEVNILNPQPYAAVIDHGWPGHNIDPQPYATNAIAETDIPGLVNTHIETALATVGGRYE